MSVFMAITLFSMRIFIDMLQRKKNDFLFFLLFIWLIDIYVCVCPWKMVCRYKFKSTTALDVKINVCLGFGLIDRI